MVMVSSSGPPSARGRTTSVSSIRTPPLPGRWTPGPTVTGTRLSSLPMSDGPRRGASRISSPMPWPTGRGEASVWPAASRTCRATRSGTHCSTPGPSASRPARCAALSVPAGTLLVLAGYFLGNWWQFAGAVVLSAGMWLVGLISWCELRPRTADRATARLLAASSAVLALTMLLALWWALGRAAGLPHPTLTWMAATHGLGNALGFALCAVLAWRRITNTVETHR